MTENNTNTDVKRPEILIRADKMLRYFKSEAPNTFEIDTKQAELIKLFWWELHNYTGADFSFNDNYTKLIKR